MNTANTIQKIVDIVFGMPTVYAFLGIGLFLTLYFRFPQIRFFWHAVRLAAGRYAKLQDFDDEPSIVKSISISMANPIGLGSVAGVALGLTLGGPGAILWMMIAGLAGMAIKLASLAANLGNTMPHPDGKGVLRGTMVLISQNFSSKFSPAAKLYSFLVILASLFAGNLFQVNQMAAVLKDLPQIHPLQAPIIGLIVALITALTLFKFSRLDRIIASFAPLMALLYLIGGMGIIFINYNQVPDAIRLIISSAFSYQSAAAGAIGLGLREIITHGVRRALFANEAGLGSHSLSKRPMNINPIQQGVAGMLGSFVDTVFTCFLTALIILTSGVWQGELSVQGIELPLMAFAKQYGNWGFWPMAVFVWLFAFSTILTWYGNGKNALAFLSSKKYQRNKFIFKIVFSLLSILGPLLPLMVIINFSDICFAGLLFINMLATLQLLKSIRQGLKKYRKDLKAERV